jgi:ASC-1-like (ASCH) protein
MAAVISGLTQSVRATPSLKANPYSFQFVTNRSPHFDFVRKMFQENMDSIYGDSQRALQKLSQENGRKCEILFKDQMPVGLIVYKSIIQQKYADDGLVDSFEVKHLMTAVSEAESKDVCDSYLINRLVRLAGRSLAKSVHIVVPDQSVKLLASLEKRGFSLVKSWNNKYSTGKVLLMKHAIAVKSGMIQAASSAEAEVEKQGERGLNKRKRDEDPQESRRELESRPPKKRELAEEMRVPARVEDVKRAEPDRAVAAPTGKRHELTLKRMYVHQIRGGGKTVEGRINSGVILRYRAGDQIRFFYQQNRSDDVTCLITDIRKYRGFKEMLETEGFKKCLTDVRSLEDAVRVYNQIPGYSERAARSGVVALHLEVIKK